MLTKKKFFLVQGRNSKMVLGAHTEGPHFQKIRIVMAISFLIYIAKIRKGKEAQSNQVSFARTSGRKIPYVSRPGHERSLQDTTSVLIVVDGEIIMLIQQMLAQKTSR